MPINYNRFITTVHQPVPKPISCILIGASPGRKMLSYGSRSLLKLDPSQSVLSRQLEIIRRVLKPSEIVLVSGFDSKRTMDHAKGIINIENEKFESTNAIRSLGIGLRAITNDSVVALNADLVFNDEALEFPIDRSLLVIDSENTMHETEVGVQIQDNKIEHLFYGLPTKWAQIGFYKAKELKLLKSIAWNPDKYNYFTFEALNEILDRGGEFEIYQPKGLKIIDIDSPKHLLLARSLIGIK